MSKHTRTLLKQFAITILMMFGCYKIFLHNFNVFPISNADVINRFRACSNAAFNEANDKLDFVNRYRTCLNNTVPNFEFDKFSMGRYDEYKIFLPLQQSFDQKKCIWLTVGIGGTVNAEKEFKAKYPGCDLFGVEASPDQYAGFEQYGKIIPYGVGKDEMFFCPEQAGTPGVGSGGTPRNWENSFSVLPIPLFPIPFDFNSWPPNRFSLPVLLPIPSIDS